MVLKDPKYKKVIAVVTAVAVGLGITAALQLTKPYAVYADGTKVEEPCAVKAGGEELFLVDSPETAENVISAVVDQYTPEGAQVNSIIIDKKITTDDKTIKRGQEKAIVLKEDEALEYVLEQNSTAEPLFSVTIDAEMGSLQGVEAQTSYQETDELYKGESKVDSNGVDGNNVVTNQITSVNGTVITDEVVDTAIIKDAIDTVILKGTKERPKDTVRQDYSGQVIGTGNGAGIAAFACQFVGNPYVYGGTSLTNGADCSGFVQSVYRNFGVSIPRTAGAQSNVGKGVSLSEAKAGDLVFYPGHVGMYIGGGQIVHASNSSRGIRIDSVGTCGSILTVRRIVE